MNSTAMLPPPGLPNCLDLKESSRSDCYLVSSTDRNGYVVYQNYRGCLNSWLATPGFLLLPTWGLASEWLLLQLLLLQCLPKACLLPMPTHVHKTRNHTWGWGCSLCVWAGGWGVLEASGREPSS